MASVVGACESLVKVAHCCDKPPPTLVPGSRGGPRAQMGDDYLKTQPLCSENTDCSGRGLGLMDSGSDDHVCANSFGLEAPSLLAWGSGGPTSKDVSWTWKEHVPHPSTSDVNGDSVRAVANFNAESFRQKLFVHCTIGTC